ncbi:MAG: VOC family protein [Myxococcota bacterium]
MRRTAPTLVTPEPVRKGYPIARASRLSHVTFERPDLARTARFLEDFGLRVVATSDAELLLRGAGEPTYCYVVRQGQRPRFVGFGLEVSSFVEIQALAAIPGATRIASVDRPGGGMFTRLSDPAGFEVEAILPARSTMRAKERPPLIDNTPQVEGIGQVVIEVADFQAASRWYTEHLGLIPSDVEVLPDGSPGFVYFRLDRGAAPTPGHTFGVAQGFVPTLGRCAFRTTDFASLRAHRRALTERGWTHVRGIGRRVVGAYLCDCWKDPYGDEHEHICQGDLVDASAPRTVHAMQAHPITPLTKVPGDRFSTPRNVPPGWLRFWRRGAVSREENCHVFS